MISECSKAATASLSNGTGLAAFFVVGNGSLWGAFSTWAARSLRPQTKAWLLRPVRLLCEV
jgi:hypothetical protein